MLIFVIKIHKRKESAGKQFAILNGVIRDVYEKVTYESQKRGESMRERVLQISVGWVY